VCVCVFACLCVWLVCALTFESLDLATSFLRRRYIFKMSRWLSYISRPSGQGHGHTSQSQTKYTHSRVVRRRLKSNLIASYCCIITKFVLAMVIGAAVQTVSVTVTRSWLNGHLQLTTHRLQVAAAVTKPSTAVDVVSAFSSPSPSSSLCWCWRRDSSPVGLPVSCIASGLQS